MPWPIDPEECAFWVCVLAVLLVLMWAQLRWLDARIFRQEHDDA